MDLNYGIRQQASCKEHIGPIFSHVIHDAYRTLYITN